MTRDERQQLVIKHWIATKGKGTCELPTGLYYFKYMKKFIDYKKLAVEYQTTNISLTKISQREKIDRGNLSKKFKNLGIEIINRQNKSKFNEHIFDSIDTEEKAYWLGFIFADGYIQFKNKNSSYTFELSLKGSDINHLYKFNKFMEYEGNNVKIGKTKCNKKEFLRCRWSITNKHLWEILNAYGCSPRKSLILNFPKKEIFKDICLIKHFIRGYFDGDGCISRYIHKNIVTPHINIIGTLSFLNEIDKYSQIVSIKKHDKRHNQNTYSNEYSKENGLNLIKYLYNNSSIYLERKYNLFKFFQNGSRSVKEFTELLSGNIGGKPIQENPEINLEIKKSKSLYSVEGETYKK